MYWEGGIQESGCLCQVEKADQVQGVYRASYGVEFFQGKDFQDGNLGQS